MKYMRHPAADLKTQAIEDHDKYLHKMSKINHESYEVISKDPDFMFHQYLRCDFLCRNIVDFTNFKIYKYDGYR